MSIYHDGNRTLQDTFDTRRLADRIEDALCHDSITEHDRSLIEAVDMFFLATATADGFPTAGYKGGDPGFVKVVDDHSVAFPNYNGNGMYMAMGNILANPKVGMLFIDFQRGNRLRIQGEASIDLEDALASEYEGAQFVVRVHTTAIFPNCPRYIPKLTLAEPSIYAPKPGTEPPEPAWKGFDMFKDAVHPRQPTFRGEP